MGLPTEHPLARALAAVRALMRLQPAQQLFNAPVDAEGLGLQDYHAIVSTPMDLGSIESTLAASEQKGFTSCAYESPDHVLAAVNLVWRNCIAYNTREDEQHIADAARHMAQATVDVWCKAGLDSWRSSKPPWTVPEPAITAMYDKFGALVRSVRVSTTL